MWLVRALIRSQGQIFFQRATLSGLVVLLALTVASPWLAGAAVLGAAVLTVASEGINAALSASGYEIPGVKQILYGVALGLSIMFMPNGIWPGIARIFGFARNRGSGTGDEGAGENAHAPRRPDPERS